MEYKLELWEHNLFFYSRRLTLLLLLLFFGGTILYSLIFNDSNKRFFLFGLHFSHVNFMNTGVASFVLVPLCTYYKVTQIYDLYCSNQVIEVIQSPLVKIFRQPLPSCSSRSSPVNHWHQETTKVTGQSKTNK